MVLIKVERTVTLTYVDEKTDPKMPIYFMDFINEAARVIAARKEREKKGEVSV